MIMTEIQRTVQSKIDQQLLQNKVIILYGARRVGKTTLVKKIVDEHANARYLNCDLHEVQTALDTTNSEQLRAFLGKYELVVLDEAQQIKNIGIILKIIHDTFEDIQLIATGSSSFELGNQLSEPLTGRSRIFHLYPVSIFELSSYFDNIELLARLPTILRYGLYPEVFNMSNEDAEEELENIASNYLYKDVLQFESIRHPDILLNLLRALALQIGNEVSYNKLSNMLDINLKTVKRYIDLLKKAFVLFELSAFSTNKRNEINKGKKYYFYDIGIRNAVLNNFNQIELRQDVGALWENFCVMERVKYQRNRRKKINFFFWRNYNQLEVDFIEESNGEMKALEFKYSAKRKIKPPRDFIEKYPDTKFEVINSTNFFDLFGE